LVPFQNWRESVMPPRLRQTLRELARERLKAICENVQDDDPDQPSYSGFRSQCSNALSELSHDAFYVPTYHYLDADNVLAWCTAVRPHLPETIGYLVRAARNAI